MKTSLIKFLFLTPLILLSSCNTNTTSNDDKFTSDINFDNFVHNVEVSEIKQRLNNMYSAFLNLDQLQIYGQVDDFKFKTQIFSSIGTSIGQEEGMFGSFEFVNKTVGLQQSNPNLIKQTTNIDKMNITIDGDGINDNGTDRVAVRNALCNIYIDNNRSYYDVSDPGVRELFPPIILIYGEAENLDDAKKTAEEIPDKFYDEDPAFKEENLPIINYSKLPSEEEFNSKLEDLLTDYNQDESSFKFKSDGKNLLIDIILTSDEISDFVYTLFQTEYPTLDKNTFTLLFNTLVSINRCAFKIVLNENDDLIYANVNVDVSIRIPNSETNETKKNTFVINGNFYFKVDEIKLNFPDDLNTYVPYLIEKRICRYLFNLKKYLLIVYLMVMFISTL